MVNLRPRPVPRRTIRSSDLPSGWLDPTCTPACSDGERTLTLAAFGSGIRQVLIRLALLGDELAK